VLDALCLLEEHEHHGSGHQQIVASYEERYGTTIRA
jgi:hypothetical protein